MIKSRAPRFSKVEQLVAALLAIVMLLVAVITYLAISNRRDGCLPPVSIYNMLGGESCCRGGSPTSTCSFKAHMKAASEVPAPPTLPLLAVGVAGVMINRRIVCLKTKNKIL